MRSSIAQIGPEPENLIARAHSDRRPATNPEKTEHVVLYLLALGSEDLEATGIDSSGKQHALLLGGSWQMAGGRSSLSRAMRPGTRK